MMMVCPHDHQGEDDEKRYPQYGGCRKKPCPHGRDSDGHSRNPPAKPTPSLAPDPTPPTDATADADGHSPTGSAGQGLAHTQPLTNGHAPQTQTNRWNRYEADRTHWPEYEPGDRPQRTHASTKPDRKQRPTAPPRGAADPRKRQMDHEPNPANAAALSTNGPRPRGLTKPRILRACTPILGQREGLWLIPPGRVVPAVESLQAVATVTVVTRVPDTPAFVAVVPRTALPEESGRVVPAVESLQAVATVTVVTRVPDTPAFVALVPRTALPEGSGRVVPAVESLQAVATVTVVTRVPDTPAFVLNAQGELLGSEIN